MADQFESAGSQANLNKLIGGLQAKQAELEQILAAAREATGELQAVSREAYATQTAQAREFSGTRPVGAATAGSIQEATQAARQLASAEGQANAEIVRQIELQARAARAARETAAQSEGIVGAAARVQRVAEPGQYQNQIEQAAASVQAARSAPIIAQAAGPAPAATQAAASSTKQLTAEEERLLASAQRTATAESQLGAATQRNILINSQASNVLQRHGAMTTEFISAAARGQVTLREFGDQIGQTVGKFAGWTVAAAAVYGVIGGVTELAKGAIDASNSVGQLERTIEHLDAQHAGQALIGLAHDTNTSMEEAGNAVFLFSRTFHNVDDAVTVARLGLMAFQLDGVALADTVKAATAIHQQFGISAQGLIPVFDELAAGQREFNARMTDQIPLLQRSASAVKNAGGDLHDFIELSTVALRTTQLSGSQLGTAFLRSAATFLNPATAKGQADRAVLASLGINPDANYTDLIMNALRRSATLSPAQRQQLSLAVFGPLLGGRTAGFFTGGAQLLPDIQKQLAPQNVKGTFLDEFAKFLSTSRQELKAVINDVQQLGAELSQSGLLAPLGLFVRALDEGLHLSGELLSVWSQMPAALREVAGLAAGAFAIRAVTQRAGLSSGVPFFGRSQATVDRSALTKGLQAEQGFYQDQYASTSRSAATAALATQASQRQVEAAVIGGTEKQQIAAERQYEAALAKQLQLETERDVLAGQTLALQERIVAVQKNLNAGMTAQAAAGAEGIAMQGANLPSAVAYRLNTLEQGKVVPNPVVATGIGAGPVGAGIVGSAAYQQQAEGEIGAGPVGAGLAKMQQTAELESAATAGALTRARTAVTGSLSKIGSGIQSLGAGVIGVLNPWIVGLLAAPFVISAIEDGQKALDEATRLSGQLPGGAARTPDNNLARAKVDQYIAQTDKYAASFSAFGLATNRALDQGMVDIQKAIDHVGQVNDQPFLQRQAIDVGNGPLQQDLANLNKKIADNSGLGAALSRGAAALVNDPLGAIFDPTKYSNDTVTDPLKLRRAQDEALIAAQTRAFNLGKPANDLPVDTINTQTQAAFNDYKSGLISFGEMQHEFDRSLKELTLSPTLSEGERADATALVADLRSRLQTKVNDIAQTLKALTSTQLDKQISDYANYLKLFGANSAMGATAMTHLRAVLGELASRAAFDPTGAVDKSGTTNLDKFAAGEQTITAAIKATVQSDLQLALATAKTRAERSAAYAVAAKDAQGELVSVNRQIAEQEAYIAKLSAKVAVEKAEEKALTATGKAVEAVVQDTIDMINVFNLSVGGIIGKMGVLSSIAPAGLGKLKQDEGALRQHQDAANILKQFQAEENKNIKDTIASYKGLSEKAVTGAPTDPFEISRLQTELAKAQAQGDPVAVAAADEHFAELELSAAHNQKQRLQARIDLANAQYAYDQAVQSVSQSYYDVLAAQADDPITKAAIEMQKAADAMAHAHGAAAYNQAKAQLIGAQKAQQQAIQDRTQSQFDLLESQTTDPVKQAAIELNKAAQATQYAKAHGGAGTQAYNEALANQNKSQQKLVEQQVSARENTIEFQLTMQQISNETAIHEYQSLLNVHGITQQLRRQVLERIQALKNEGQSEFAALDLGSIRLPTPYEIRRAVLAAQAGINVTNHYSTQIQVTDERSALAVGVQMDRYHSGTGKSIQRAVAGR